MVKKLILIELKINTNHNNLKKTNKQKLNLKNYIFHAIFKLM